MMAKWCRRNQELLRECLEKQQQKKLQNSGIVLFFPASLNTVPVTQSFDLLTNPLMLVTC